MPFVPDNTNELVQQMLMIRQMLDKKRIGQVSSQIDLLQPGQSLGEAGLDPNMIQKVLGLKQAPNATTVLKPKTAASINDDIARQNEPTTRQTATVTAGTQLKMAQDVAKQVDASITAWNAAAPEVQKVHAQEVAGVVGGITGPVKDNTVAGTQTRMANQLTEQQEAKVKTLIATTAFKDMQLGEHSALAKELRKVGVSYTAGLTASTLGLTGLLNSVGELSMRIQSTNAERDTALTRAIADQATRIAAATGDKVPVNAVVTVLQGRLLGKPVGSQSPYIEQLIDRATDIAWQQKIGEGLEKGDPEVVKAMNMIKAIGTVKSDDQAAQVNKLIRGIMARMATTQDLGVAPPEKIQDAKGSVVDNPAHAQWNWLYNRHLNLTPSGNSPEWKSMLKSFITGTDPATSSAAAVGTMSGGAKTAGAGTGASQSDVDAAKALADLLYGPSK